MLCAQVWDIYSHVGVALNNRQQYVYTLSHYIPRKCEKGRQIQTKTIQQKQETTVYYNISDI